MEHRVEASGAILEPGTTATPASASTPKQHPSTDLEGDKSAAAPTTTTTTTTEPQKLKLEIDLEAVQVETSNTNVGDEKTKLLPHDHENSNLWILKFLMELTLFLVLVGIFVAVLASDVLQDTRIWNLGAWRMCILVFLALSGWIVAKWVMDVVVFLVYVWACIFKNRHVAFLVRGLKGSVAVFIWVAAILVAWIFLFRHAVEIIPERINEDLDKVTRGLAATLVGIFLWILKSLLMQILAWFFIVTRSESAVVRNCEDHEQVKKLWNLASAENKDEKSQTPGRKILEDEYNEITSARRNWTPRYLLRMITDTELPVFVEAEKREHISVERAARATADQLCKMIAKKFEPNRSTGKGVEVKSITIKNRKDDRIFTNKEDHRVHNKSLLKELEEVIPLIKLHFDRDTHRILVSSKSLQVR